MIRNLNTHWILDIKELFISGVVMNLWLLSLNVP